MRKAVWCFAALVACGENGATLIDTQVEPAGENCSAGGVRVSSGVDKNGNGTLETNEATSVDYICEGSDGATGASGDDGEQGGTSACAELPQLQLTEVSALLAPMMLDETQELVFTTNAPDRSRLAVTLTQENPDLEIVDLGEGRLAITSHARTLDNARPLFVLSDGCTQVFRNVEVPETDSPPAWLQFVSLDGAFEDFNVRVQDELGPISIFPEQGKIGVGDATETRELPSATYTAEQYLGAIPANIGTIELEPGEEQVVVLWENGIVDEAAQINRPTSVPSAGKALARVWQLNEALPLMDAYTGDTLVSSFWVPGNYFEVETDGDLRLHLVDSGEEPTSSNGFLLAVDGMVPGVAYDVYVYGATSGAALAVPADGSVDEIDGTLGVYSEGTIAEDAEVTIPDGTTSTEDIPYPSNTDWVAFGFSADIDNPDSQSWRTLSVPGATSLLVTVDVDLNGPGAYLQARQSDGTMILGDVDNVTGTTTVSFSVDGDSVELSVHVGLIAPFGFGYRVTQIAYEG